VFVDDRLHVEELFPTAKAQFEKWTNRSRHVIPAMAAVLIALIVLALSGVLPR
jgi:hypothetical protein